MTDYRYRAAGVGPAPTEADLNRLTDELIVVRRDLNVWRDRAVACGWTLDRQERPDGDAPTAVLPAITPEVVELVRRECERAVREALAARDAGELREVPIERTPYATTTRAVTVALRDVESEILANADVRAIDSAVAAVRKVATAWGVTL
jgi:hypothetical protein